MFSSSYDGKNISHVDHFSMVLPSTIFREILGHHKEFPRSCSKKKAMVSTA